MPQVVTAQKGMKGQLENYTAVKESQTPEGSIRDLTLRLSGKPRGWKREQLLFSEVIFYLEEGYGASLGHFGGWGLGF